MGGRGGEWWERRVLRRRGGLRWGRVLLVGAGVGGDGESVVVVIVEPAVHVGVSGRRGPADGLVSRSRVLSRDRK